MRLMIWLGLPLLALLAAACGSSDDRPTAEEPAAAQPQTGGAGVATPTGGRDTYPLSAIKAIPDSCSTPSVLLATAPKSVGASYPFNITRQALLANQQYRVVSGPPAAPGEVSLATHAYNDSAYALVATCKDGGTCNQLAAMYKAVVRSSRPQVVCGKVQGISASPVGSGFGWQGTPQANLPAEKDAVALCARLSACRIATDQSTPGDPFLECQKAPHKFKTDCARRYPCAEVLACTGN